MLGHFRLLIALGTRGRLLRMLGCPAHCCGDVGCADGLGLVGGLLLLLMRLLGTAAGAFASRPTSYGQLQMSKQGVVVSAGNLICLHVFLQLPGQQYCHG